MSVAVADYLEDVKRIPQARREGELSAHLTGLTLAIQTAQCHANNIYRALNGANSVPSDVELCASQLERIASTLRGRVA